MKVSDYRDLISAVSAKKDSLASAPDSQSASQEADELRILADELRLAQVPRASADDVRKASAVLVGADRLLAARAVEDVEDFADTVSDLLELAQKLRLPDDAFDGDIDDTCIVAAREKAAKMKDTCMIEKLEFFLESGFSKKRLAEMMELIQGN